MAWENIIGHNKIKEILSRTIQNNKIASAYIFNGLDGIGKEAIALEFAKLLNDDNSFSKNGLINVSDEFDKRWDNNVLNHNNINIIFPIPSGKSSDPKNNDPESGLSKVQIEQIKNQLTEKSNNYYHKITIDKANAIRINQIRKIKNDLKYSNSGNGYRVFIISDAHLMNNEAANSFLKTIEEPSEKTAFILCTNNSELIPQTIRSRCQLIRFSPLSNDDLTNYLVNKHSPEQIDLILPFANGSIRKAQEFSGDDLNELRENIIELLRSSLKRNNYFKLMMDNINKILVHNNKQYFEKALMLLSLWLKDAYNLKLGNSRVVNKDQIEPIKKFSEIFFNSKFDKAILEIESSLLKLKQNVNPQLVFVSLMMHFRKVFLK